MICNSNLSTQKVNCYFDLMIKTIIIEWMTSNWKTFPTLLSSISFVLCIDFHSSFCVVTPHPLILVLFCSPSQNKKKERVWYFLLYAINFRFSHLLVWFYFASSSFFEKEKKKIKLFTLIFVAVFCVSILSF